MVDYSLSQLRAGWGWERTNPAVSTNYDADPRVGCQQEVSREAQPSAGAKRGKRDWLDNVPHLVSIEQHFKSKAGKGDSPEVVGEVKGADLLGWEYDGPFDDVPAQQHEYGYPEEVARVVKDRGWAPAVTGAAAHKVVSGGKDVTETEGTGIVHTAPGCGAIDFQWGKDNGLPPVAPLDDGGLFLDGFGPLSHLNAVEPSTADAVFEELKKKDRLFELAAEWETPVVFFTEGGGGRPGDVDTEDLFMSWLDLKTFSTWPQLGGIAPRIAVNSGRCYAGNAVIFGCADITIATRNSNIGLAGPAMIEGGGLGRFKPEDIGPIEVQTANGVVDIACEDEAEATAVARQVLGCFQGAVTTWDCADQRVLRHLIPEDRLRVYDIRAVIEALADTGSVIEFRRDYGVGLITALIRVEGQAFGVIANDPRHLGGAIDGDGGEKGGRFLQLCDTFGVPVLSLCDTPGFMVGPDSEKTAAVRRGSRLILASASPARRELLARLGRPFDVRPADIDEPTGFTDPRREVQTVSWLKAAAVAPHIDSGVILSADTIGWVDGEAILKPRDEADARRILRQLGGREHELWTGVCLWQRPSDRQYIWQEVSVVRMRQLSEPEIDAYLATRQWQGCSGAYSIRERDDPYLTIARGSLSNVIGLPMESLERAFADVMNQVAELLGMTNTHFVNATGWPAETT